MTNARVTVDYTAVEKMLPVLECLSQGLMPSDQQVDDLLATPGMSTWFSHVQRYGRKLDDVLYRDILRAVLGQSNRKGHGVDWLRQNIGRVDVLQRILEQLQQLDLQALCDQAYALANQHLTLPFTEPVNLYFMCSTRGSAIVLGQTMVMDIADFHDPAQEPFPVEYILATFAHEVFHMGRAKIFAHRPEPCDISGKLVHQLLGMLWEEGIATYLFNQKYSEEQAGWLDAWDNPAPTMDKVVEIIRLSLSEVPDERELLNRIFSLFGVEGYVLGTRMCKVIADTLGKVGLDRCAVSHYAFLTVYNEAVEQAHLELPKFPTEISSMVMKLDPAR